MSDVGSAQTDLPNMIMSRQMFLRGAGLLGLGALAGGFSVWPNVSFGQDGAPVSGEILTCNVSGDPPHFDPVSGTSSFTMLVVGPCYNGLVRYDPQSPEKIIPDLAKSWEVSPDGKTYTFALIDNAKFHDGKPMTSKDVKFTFDHIRKPPEGVVSARKTLLSVVDAIETPDTYTVRFLLKRPSPSFLANLASGWMVVLPKHVLEIKGAMTKDVVGTGPYKFKEYEGGVKIVMEKNPDYHVAGRPYLDGITAYIIPDAGTTSSYFQSGQILWYVTIQGQEAGTIKTGGDVTVLSTPSTSFVGPFFNTRTAPFDNILVRKAACLAIDREAGLQVTYGGNGKFGGLSVPGRWELPQAELETVPGYDKLTADIEQAKALLAEAGHVGGVKVNLLVRKNPQFVPVAVFLKDQWAKVEIDATIDIQETASFFSRVRSGDFQACASGAALAITDPDAVFGEYVCNDALNSTGVCQPEIDALFNKQSETMDPAARLAISHELEKRILAEYTTYVMYWRNRFMGISNRLHGMKIHPNIDQNMRLEDVWLSS